MKKIKDLPISDRPYEKCYTYGAEYLTDVELLSVILRTGTNGISAFELSSHILNNSLLNLMQLTCNDLLKIKGVGKVKAVQILCIAELAKRISKANASKKVKFDNPSLIAQYYMEQLRHLNYEMSIALYLDSKCNLIFEHIISKGSINMSMMDPREIFVHALKNQAVNIIIMHNHPSGDPTPSRDDINTTNRIDQGAKLIGLHLLDHIIIGDNTYKSFRELDLLS